MDRRYEFVSEGAQTARWLQRLVGDGLCACGDRVLRAVGKALIAVGAWLQHKRQLDSIRA
jgi:hypothetical protein